MHKALWETLNRLYYWILTTNLQTRYYYLHLTDGINWGFTVITVVGQWLSVQVVSCQTTLNRLSFLSINESDSFFLQCDNYAGKGHISLEQILLDSIGACVENYAFPDQLSGQAFLDVPNTYAAAAAKSLQSCPTLCVPIDSSPWGSPVPGILQARTLEGVAISFSNAWKWKVKVNWLSRVQPLATPWTAAHQAPLSMGFSRQEYWSGVPLPSLA